MKNYNMFIERMREQGNTKKEETKKQEQEAKPDTEND